MSLPYEFKMPPDSWIGWQRYNELSDRGDDYNFMDHLTSQEQDEFGKLVKYIQTFQKESVPNAIIEKSCSSPDFIAVCVVMGGAFDVDWQEELIQRKDGSYLHSEWVSPTLETSQKVRADLQLDLPAELEMLRNGNYDLRGEFNRNQELETGEGFG